MIYSWTLQKWFIRMLLSSQSRFVCYEAGQMYQCNQDQCTQLGWHFRYTVMEIKKGIFLLPDAHCIPFVLKQMRRSRTFNHWYEFFCLLVPSLVEYWQIDKSIVNGSNKLALVVNQKWITA